MMKKITSSSHAAALWLGLSCALHIALFRGEVAMGNCAGCFYDIVGALDAARHQ